MCATDTSTNDVWSNLLDYSNCRESDNYNLNITNEYEDGIAGREYVIKVDDIELVNRDNYFESSMTKIFVNCYLFENLTCLIKLMWTDTKKTEFWQVHIALETSTSVCKNNTMVHRI